MQKIPLTTIAALALLDDLASGAVREREKGFTESEMIFCGNTWNVKWPGAISCLCQCAIYSETRIFFYVIRAVNCTHIVIEMPSQDKFVYVNRKNFNLITLQEHNQLIWVFGGLYQCMIYSF